MSKMFSRLTMELTRAAPKALNVNYDGPSASTPARWLCRIVYLYINS